MKITQEMTDELNTVLANMGCSFKLNFREEPLNNAIEIVPMNIQFIESAIINPTKYFYRFLENFFKRKGIEELSYNNTRTVIWSKNGYTDDNS